MTIKLYFKKILGHKFYKSLVLLLRGTAAGYLIVIISSPLLTRLYSPQEFGVLALYISILSILTPIVTLKYELAIPIVKEEKNSVGLVLLSSFFAISVSFLLLILFYLERDLIVKFFKLSSPNGFMVLLFFGLLFSGLYQIFNLFSIRKKAYKLMSRGLVAQNIGLASTQIGVAFSEWAIFGLIFGHLISKICYSGNLFGLFRADLARNIKIISVKDCWFLITRYRKFGFYSSVSGSVNAVGLQILPVLLTLFYTQELVGQFSLSIRIVSLPMVFFGRALANIYLSEGADLVRRTPKSFMKYFQSISKKLFFFGFVLLGLVAFPAPLYFPIVFGEEWYDAGIYTLILFPAFWGQLIISPLSNSLNLVEKQGLQLAGDLIRILVVVGGIFIAYKFNLPDIIVISIYSTSVTISYLIYYIIFKKNLIAQT